MAEYLNRPHTGVTIPLLDHGFVRLLDYMGDDLAIVRAARNSYDAAWRAGKDAGSDHKLMHYLWSNWHSTPFEVVEFQFEVKAPIFVFRQWHRHRTHSYNEVSARYTELPEEFYVPSIDQMCAQSKSNKQGRGEPLHTNTATLMREEMFDQNRAAHARYRTLLKWGLARELARTVLPLSTYSKMFDKVDLWNLLQFCERRLDPHAQYEIRVYAEAICQLIKPIVPVALAAFAKGRPAIPLKLGLIDPHETED